MVSLTFLALLLTDLPPEPAMKSSSSSFSTTRRSLGLSTVRRVRVEFSSEVSRWAR